MSTTPTPSRPAAANRYALIITVMLAAGYDGLTAGALILLGAGIGVIGSTVNPFATGIASGFAGTTISEGLVGRLEILVVGTILGIVFVMRYAERVKKDPSKSLIFDMKAENEKQFMSGGDGTDFGKFTGRHKVILVLFFLAFVTMVYGVIPWEDLGFAIPTWWWWFPEMTANFLFFGILIGIIGRLGMRQLRMLGDRHGGADFLDWIVLEERVHDVFAALLSRLGEPRDWTRMTLRGIAADSACTAHLSGGDSESHATFCSSKGFRCPSLPMPASMEDFVKTSEATFKLSARRRLRKLSKLPGCECEVTLPESRLLAGLEDMFAMHRERWRSRSRHRMFEDERIPAFFRRVVPPMHRQGWLELSEMKLQDEPLAVLLGFVFDDTYSCLVSATGVKGFELKAGNALMYRRIESLIGRVRRFSFLRGDEPCKYLYIKTYVEKNDAVLEIRDTGSGVPEEDRSFIFNPFYTTKALGTGLGLAITHKIIQEHNGRIEVESAVDKGTVFKVFMPIKEEEK